MSRWWSLAQTLIWLIRRIEMLPRDAEQIANSPEMSPKIGRALNELKREACKAVLGVTEGMPVDKFRILCGHRYVDLLTLIQIPPTAEPGALSAIMHELQEGIRWQDVECSSDWVKRAWPAPAPAADASVPVATTEAPVAKPEAASPSPVDTMITEAAKESSAPKKQSRKKTTHGGAQTRRATAVLNRIFPKEGKYRDRYPDEDEMAWQDVWIMFSEEYSRYAKEHPSNYSVHHRRLSNA
jgi:hypothetical protein